MRGAECGRRDQVEEPFGGADGVVERLSPRVAAVLTALGRVEHDERAEGEAHGQGAGAVEVAHGVAAECVEVVIADSGERQASTDETLRPAIGAVQTQLMRARDEYEGLAALLDRPG
jgi:hypothetical protein